MTNPVAVPTAPAFSSGLGRLAPEQVAHFKKEGYTLFHEPVFAPAKFQALRDHFEALLARHVGEGGRPEAMDKPHFIDTKLFDWVLSDEILDLVEPVLGPDILLFSTHFICKPKGDGKRVPWHEDSGYWRGMMDPMEVVTVWLAIDESTEENGCMFVVPRSHAEGKRGFSDYELVDTTTSVFGTEIVKPQQHADKAVPCVLGPNECSLHDARLIHGSAANTSAKRRCGFTMRFVPGHVRLAEESENRIRFYPARGRDLAGNNLADPTKTYPDLYTAQQTGRKIH